MTSPSASLAPAIELETLPFGEAPLCSEALEMKEAMVAINDLAKLHMLASNSRSAGPSVRICHPGTSTEVFLRSGSSATCPSASDGCGIGSGASADAFSGLTDIVAEYDMTDSNSYLGTDDEFELEGVVHNAQAAAFLLSSEKKRCGYMEGILNCVRDTEVLTAFHIALVQGKVCYFACSRVGHEVIVAMLEKLENDLADELVEAFVGNVDSLGANKYGSRVLRAALQTQLRRAPHSLATRAVIMEMVGMFDDLACCPLGHRVLKTLFAEAPPRIQSGMVDLLAAHPLGITVLCSDNYTSSVVEHIIRLAPESELEKLAEPIFEDGLYALSVAPFCLRVIDAMLCRGSLRLRTIVELRDVSGELVNYRFGRSLARRCGIVLPNVARPGR